MSEEKLGRIEIAKQALNFSAAHFTIFSATEREDLHGHNWQVECELTSTIDANGRSTVSPKGDHPGFVHIADRKTLYLPERSGNRLIFTLQNILATGQVGMLFMRPNTTETLRVNGRCELIQDDALCQQLAARGLKDRLGAFVHFCAKLVGAC